MDFDCAPSMSHRPHRLVEHCPAIDIRQLRRAQIIIAGQVSALLGTVHVGVTWLHCHFGNARPLWHCPQCGRKVYVLYQCETIACRRCLDLAYYSQRLVPEFRLSHRAIQMRERLGQKTGGIVDPFPKRPKGRHWRTFVRDRRKVRVLERQVWTHKARKLGMID